MTDAEWAPPLLAGVLGNRGNARSRQGNLSGALDDYNAAIVRAHARMRTRASACPHRCAHL